MDFTLFILSQWETWVFIAGLLVMIGCVVFIFINEKDGKGLFSNKECLLKEIDFVKKELDLSNTQLILLKKLLYSYKKQLDDTEKLLELYKANLDKASKLSKRTITSKKGK